MKSNLIFLAFIFLCSGAYAQPGYSIHGKGDSATLKFLDSSLILLIDGREYLRIPKNKTLYLTGSAEVWDDLRVPVTATTAAGSNPPVFSAFSNSGGSYSGGSMIYDGINDFDSIPAEPRLNFSKTDFTFSFWITPDPDIKNDANILYKKGGWNVSVQNRKIRVYLEGKPVFLSSSELYMGSRNFVTISGKNFAGGCNLYVYINNKFSGRQMFERPLTDNTSVVYIGKAEHRGYGNHFSGAIDELHFWNKFLDDTERDSLWNKSMGTHKIIARSNHVAGFSMDDKQGRILSSHSESPVIKAYSLNESTSPAPGTGIISENIISHGVFGYSFSKDIPEELFFTAQLPHSWIEGSQIEPHLHWAGAVTDTGKIVWGLEFTWTNMQDEFPPTTVIYTTSTGAHKAGSQVYSSFGMVDGAGKKISSMLVCRVFRNADHPEDTYNGSATLLEIDFHIRLNTLGSPGMSK